MWTLNQALYASGWAPPGTSKGEEGLQDIYFIGKKPIYFLSGLKPDFNQTEEENNPCTPPPGYCQASPPFPSILGIFWKGSGVSEMWSLFCLSGHQRPQRSRTRSNVINTRVKPRGAQNPLLWTTILCTHTHTQTYLKADEDFRRNVPIPPTQKLNQLIYWALPRHQLDEVPSGEARKKFYFCIYRTSQPTMFHLSFSKHS